MTLISSLPDTLEDLDEYLNQSEQKSPDIIPGTEKTIHWHNSTVKSRTEYSLVYLHGFSASRQEISPVCEKVALKWGANIFFSRLTGHGRGGDAMNEITLERLLSDANEAINIGRQIGEKVIVIGTSTGATLATWLAVNNSQALYALVLISPNYGLKRKESELLRFFFGKLFLKLRQGDVYRFTPDNAKQKKYWTTEYPSSALIPMIQLVNRVRKLPLQNINVPLLTLYSENDQIVNVKAIKKYANKFGSKPNLMIPVKKTGGSQRHILAGDILSPATTPEVVEKILTFLRKLH